MALHALFGHSHTRERLAQAVAAGHLPQVILITGARGVGKQRLGLWLAQLLFCDRGGAEPCGECRACRQVLGLAWPDLHWFMPIPRPKAGDADRQVEEAGDLIGEVIAERRERPLYAPPDGMASHSVASARLMLRKAALTPVAGKRKVFLVGEAERLVAQDASPEAANALLKFLEEPPADTWVILTTTEPERVLPTIRSRSAQLRVSRLPDAVMREAAAALLDPRPSGEALEALIRHADGAIGRLIADVGADAKVRGDAHAILAGLEAGAGGRFERGLRQAPWQARGGFTDLLDVLAEELAERARAAAGQGPSAVAPLVRALERVQAVRADAQKNVNPQLLLATLTAELAGTL
jgi:DNA polymerase-3 subunit delta'